MALKDTIEQGFKENAAETARAKQADDDRNRLAAEKTRQEHEALLVKHRPLSWLEQTTWVNDAAMKDVWPRVTKAISEFAKKGIRDPLYIGHMRSLKEITLDYEKALAEKNGYVNVRGTTCIIALPVSPRVIAPDDHLAAVVFLIDLQRRFASEGVTSTSQFDNEEMGSSGRDRAVVYFNNFEEDSLQKRLWAFIAKGDRISSCEFKGVKPRTPRLIVNW